MEYSIYINYRCNLRCSFCYVKRRLSLSETNIIKRTKINRIIKYISNSNNREKKDLLVFYGGEPLMDYCIMKEFIKKTQHLNLLYVMYTNGLLLDSVPISLLRSLNIIFVSINGDARAQEKDRGSGTFKKVMDNIIKLKPRLNNFIIGRITATEETNIYKSVLNLIDYVDAVYWQIVNKPKFGKADNFINHYKKGIRTLFDFWLKNFKNGRNLNIIPFQAIAASLVFDYPQNKWFRCGAGSRLQTIDIDGNIYWCDEYVGVKKAMVGNIESGRVNLQNKINTDIFSDCKRCEVSSICLGRCRRCLEEYSISHVRNYCILSKYLIKIISRKKNIIKNIIRRRGYAFEDFYPASIYDCTEEIP